VNNDVQRNLMIFFTSSFLAAMLVSTASAKSPRETANDTRTHFNARISKSVSRDVVSRVPTDNDLNSSQQDLPSYLADYVYSEVPPNKKPADTVRDSLKDVPIGTPIEEIKRASDTFGLDFNFMNSAPGRISVYFNSAKTSSRSMGPETFLMLEITLSPPPTSSPLRRYFSS
jgi:hypothetical protein